MSKLCQYCGAEMDNEAYECPECLKKIPGAEMLMKQKEAEKKEKRNKTLKITGLAVAVVAVITGLTFLVTFLTRKESDIYMKPVDAYIEGCVENEYDKYISAFPEFYQQMFNQQFAYIVMGEMTDDEEKIRTADMLYHDQYYRSLASEFGTDFDLTYKIYRETRMTAEDLKKYQEEYASFNPELLSNDVFEDGYEIAVTFTAKGNLGSNNVTNENFRVVKINDQWYMMDYVDFLYVEEETNLENK